MKIGDLKGKQSFSEIDGHVSYVGKLPEPGKNFQQIEIDDGTGRMRHTVWDEQVGMFTVGDTVKIAKGYVDEYPKGSGKLKLAIRKTDAKCVKTGHDADYRPNNLSPQVMGGQTTMTAGAPFDKGSVAAKPKLGLDDMMGDFIAALKTVELHEKDHIDTGGMPEDWTVKKRIDIAIAMCNHMWN